MAKKPLTLLEAREGTEQLSDKAIKERLRPSAISAAKRIIELQNSKNDNVALGASKYVLDKFVPNLTAIDLTSLGEKILNGPIIYKPSTFNENMETVRKAGDST